MLRVSAVTKKYEYLAACRESQHTGTIGILESLWVSDEFSMGSLGSILKDLHRYFQKRTQGCFLGRTQGQNLTAQGFLDESLVKGKPEGNPKAGLQYTPKGVQLTLSIENSRTPLTMTPPNAFSHIVIQNNSSQNKSKVNEIK